MLYSNAAFPLCVVQEVRTPFTLRSVAYAWVADSGMAQGPASRALEVA